MKIPRRPYRSENAAEMSSAGIIRKAEINTAASIVARGRFSVAGLVP